MVIRNIFLIIEVSMSTERDISLWQCDCLIIGTLFHEGRRDGKDTGKFPNRDNLISQLNAIISGQNAAFTKMTILLKKNFAGSYSYAAGIFRASNRTNSIS